MVVDLLGSKYRALQVVVSWPCLRKDCHMRTGTSRVVSASHVYEGLCKGRDRGCSSVPGEPGLSGLFAGVVSASHVYAGVIRVMLDVVAGCCLLGVDVYRGCKGMLDVVAGCCLLGCLGQPRVSGVE
jgi:hypothetical protein